MSRFRNVNMEPLRLHKLIARAGLASRRTAEAWIRAGRVSVNGTTVTDMGVSVDPARDAVRVDGQPVRIQEETITLVVHKPRHCVTTLKDPQGRPTVGDLIGHEYGRLFPVGRLDWDAEGLLLLTNDGPLANRLMHPRYGVAKTYEIKVKGIPTAAVLERLRTGVVLAEGTTAPAEVRQLRALGDAAWLRVVLHQGWNRQLKRMGLAVGHPVLKIRRVAYGPIRLGGLTPGRYRRLSADELSRLKQAAGLA